MRRGAAANNNRLPNPFLTTVTGGDSSANTGVRINGGNFTLMGNATTPVNQTTNRFDVFAGTITIQNTGANVRLTTGRVNRTDNDSIGLIRGTNLGLGTGPTHTNVCDVRVVLVDRRN